ncbi:hypothetical protein [Magnetovibrio sp.]|uniref:hypothetical protein n=1 Tax=Magnetovibrio sp. TaxID=2024836 RepID=UPI002F935AFD
MAEQQDADNLNRRVMGIPNYVLLPLKAALSTLVIIPLLMFVSPEVFEDYPWVWGGFALVLAFDIFLFLALRKAAFKLRVETAANGSGVDGASDRAVDEHNQPAVKRRR